MEANQICYVYDGSFEGLLTAVYEAYYQSQPPDSIVSQTNYQENLLIKKILIQTDCLKADKVYDSIIKKISYEVLQKVYCVFLSELPESATMIYQYLRLGWKLGGKVNFYLSEQKVLDVHTVFKKVTKEKHRMLGLIRFRKIKGNIYYAPIEPDYNIIGLLAPHFSRRFNDQNFIIHDVKRNTAVVYNCSEWIISDFTANQVIALDNDEENVQSLWKEFFNSIAIKSKINPRLQKQFMPKRYWKYLIEK
ncbi:MAG: TIGR03915 family putative DNA repair protein [Deltaproteobacteria bacterium]